MCPCYTQLDKSILFCKGFLYYLATLAKKYQIPHKATPDKATSERTTLVSFVANINLKKK